MKLQALKFPLLLSFAFILCMSSSEGTSTNNDGHSMFNLTESEYLTLEGGYMLPEAETTAKVERELALIREKFSAVRNISHNRKWIPGQVLTTRIKQEQISKINSSSFGPLEHVEKIDVMPFFHVTVMSFTKPYSPPELSKTFETELGVLFTPNAVYYEYEVDNISYKAENSTYTFKRGTGMCKDNCPDRYLWEIKIDENGTATLIKEWAVPQNGERVIIY